MSVRGSVSGTLSCWSVDVRCDSSDLPLGHPTIGTHIHRTLVVGPELSGFPKPMREHCITRVAFQSGEGWYFQPIGCRVRIVPVCAGSGLLFCRTSTPIPVRQSPFVANREPLVR
jgi:hypothetical protein